MLLDALDEALEVLDLVVGTVDVVPGEVQHPLISVVDLAVQQFVGGLVDAVGATLQRHARRAAERDGGAMSSKKYQWPNPTPYPRRTMWSSAVRARGRASTSQRTAAR
jgi:hypothetical protein